MVVSFEYEAQPLEIDLKALQKAVSNAGASTMRFFDAQTIAKDLSPVPGKVKYPIEWTRSAQPAGRAPNMYDGTYSKQKAAFFATDGFGKGIPSKRSGKLGKSWRMESEPINTAFETGIELVTTNKAKYAPFVLGAPPGIKPMQQFHRNTGWQAVETRFPLFAEKVVDEFQTELFIELRQVVIIKEVA